jgi:glycosyltransferase involved in cell wall biosynthesis
VITLSGRVGRVGEAVRQWVEQFHVLRPPRGFSLVAPTGLLRALRATRPHVVHIHSGAWMKAAYAAKLASVPRVIYTEHGREHHDPWLSRVQDHVASLGTHRVVAVSERLRRYMIRAVAVKPERVVTIPNGVDTDTFAPGASDASLRHTLQLPDDALVIGSVGRLEPVKAYSRLVAAYASIRTSWPGRPLVLVIFGEGSDRGAIEAEAQRLGVRDGLRLPGWTDAPAAGYRLFDIFAMTSRSEGMSVSLMEAMSCGVCPVVTNVGSNAEVLGPSLREHVVPDGDEEQLRSVLRDLLESTEKRQVAGALARATAVERHSLRRMILEYERLYRDEPSDGGVAVRAEPEVLRRDESPGQNTETKTERVTAAGRAWSA